MTSKLPLPTAVIWDMDGTMIDQTQPIIRCFAQVIENLGYPSPDPREIHRSMGGPMASTMGLFVDAADMDQACKDFRALFPSIMFDGLIILKGTQELIQHFAEKNIPQAILTNKHGPTARIVSEHCEFSKYIHKCIGNTDTEWHKPQAELTEHALAQIESSTDGALLIGDSPTDVATAHNAGLNALTVATGAHTENELLEAGADWTFPDLAGALSAFQA